MINNKHQANRVITIIQSRLELMPQVAAWKYLNKSRVWQPEREKEILTKQTLEAKKLGLDLNWVKSVLQGQMDAAKIIQWAQLCSWRIAPPSFREPISDLLTEIRPKLDTLTANLLHELKGLAPFRFDSASRQHIKTIIDKLSNSKDEPPLVWKLALKPLITLTNC